MTKAFTILLAMTVSVFLSARDIQNEVVFVTGGTKGIGLETAKHFVNARCCVYAAGRGVNEDLILSYPDINFIHMDISDSSSIKEAINYILSKENRIDILVNNAGYGIIGAEEAVSIKQARELFDVNFFGLVELTQMTLPSMRKNKRGHIINISSTSGIRALPGLGFYAASKFAVEGYSEALAFTVSPWDIKVSIVEPGTVKNQWGANCELTSQLDDVETYQNLKNSLSSKICQLARQIGQPVDEIASLIVGISQLDNPSVRYQTSSEITKKLSVLHNDLTGDKNLTIHRDFYESLIK